MQYQQQQPPPQPQPEQQRGSGNNQGCLMGCIAALCCCCAVEEGCECWYVTFCSITFCQSANATITVSIFANASSKQTTPHISELQWKAEKGGNNNV
jgi:hypothetical protein